MFGDLREINFASWMKAEIVRKTTLSYTSGKFDPHPLKSQYISIINACNCMHIYAVKWGVYNLECLYLWLKQSLHLTVSQRQRLHNVYG